MEFDETVGWLSPMDDLRVALSRLWERLVLEAVDDDGSLRETARMLALKRGCRRR